MGTTDVLRTFEDQQKRGIATASTLVLMPLRVPRKDCAEEGRGTRIAAPSSSASTRGGERTKNNSGSGNNWGQTVGFLTLS